MIGIRSQEQPPWRKGDRRKFNALLNDPTVQKLFEEHIPSKTGGLEAEDEAYREQRNMIIRRNERDNRDTFSKLLPYCESHSCGGLSEKPPCEIKCDGEWIEVMINGKKTNVYAKGFKLYTSKIELTPGTEELLTKYDMNKNYITPENISLSDEPSMVGDLALFCMNKMTEKNKSYCSPEESFDMCPIWHICETKKGPGYFVIPKTRIEEAYRAIKSEF